MPKGEGQEDRERGPYKRDKDEVEIRRHKAPRGWKPPRKDVHRLRVPEDDPDLIDDQYKPKKSDEQIDRVVNQHEDHEVEKMAQDIYEDALENHQDIWQKAHKEYPDSNSHEALPATEFILGQIGELYAQEYSFDIWAQLRPKLFSKAHSGLT